MNQVTENLRFLLWNATISRDKWQETLADWAGCDLQRAEQLLKGAFIKPREQEQVAKKLNLGSDGPERIQSVRLLDEHKIDILRENLDYLLGDLKRGEKGSFSERLGVETETLRRWRVGKHTPQRENLDSLCRVFGLGYGVNLETNPIFLSMTPIGEKRKKNWLKERISRLDNDTLNDLFPALKRLLR